MKIVFVTYHNWETKRHGGFHALAEFACQNGHDVVFFSFSRPFKIFRAHDERLNKEVLKKLIKGIKYKVGGGYITNVTWPTLSPNGKMKRIFPNKLVKWLDYHSIIPFRSFSNKWLKGADCFVIESNESVMLYDRIRKYYPNAKIMYRPSDPIIDNAPTNTVLCNKEIEILPKVDLLLLVNEEGLDLYKMAIPNFEQKCKYKILHNGVYVKDFQKKYPRPTQMKSGKSVTYIGVEGIEWNLIIETAKQIPEAYFYLIMPIVPPQFFIDIIKDIQNIIYISGIPHCDVPSWINNSDVIMSPTFSGFYKQRKSICITAKNLKAIAANKPHVVFNNNPVLAKYGVTTTYTYDEFICEIKNALQEGRREYRLDINEYDWNVIGKTFLELI